MTEKELDNYHTHLESLVRERTADLLKANDLLRQEIVERIRAEEAMRTAILDAEEEKAKSEAIIAAMGDGVTILDTDFRILYQNLIHKELLGDHMGEYCYKAYRDRDRLCPGCPVKRSFSDGGVHRAESKISTQERGLLYLEQTASPLRDASGKIIAVVEVVRNVTERKKMEEELLRTEKLESLGILSGGIAHDFNNLLTALLGNISLAKVYTDRDDRIYEILIEAEKVSRRARDLTRQLLTFSKGGAPIKKITSIAGLVKDSTAFSLHGSNVRCDISVPEDIWPVEIDEGQISQVINNLVINAQQAMPKGGIVRVSCRNMEVGDDDVLVLKAGRYVEICIKDQGVGIPPQYLDKIFDPYFTTKQTGSGLGLATAYSIISKHEGLLTVESTHGEGTTFHIFLPASDKEIPVTRKKKKLLKGHGRVLVMDDEDVIRMIVGKMLNSMGYEPETVESGEQAIETYRHALESGRRFDAVIIDLTIRGGMGGMECIKKLLALDPTAKAIVSSGYSDDPVMSSYQEFGFKGIITKPYQIEDLSEILNRVLTG